MVPRNLAIPKKQKSQQPKHLSIPKIKNEKRTLSKANPKVVLSTNKDRKRTPNIAKATKMGNSNSKKDLIFAKYILDSLTELQNLGWSVCQNGNLTLYRNKLKFEIKCA